MGRKRISRILRLCCCLLMAVLFFPQDASARETEARYELPFDVNAKSYIVASIDTGEIIFEKDSHRQLIPASLTKLLTAYTVYQYMDPSQFDSTMITAPQYIYDELYGQNGSTADIRRGETLSVTQLLYALLLPSANEAADILADYFGNGSIPNFCLMMNNEAKKLGCTDTNFTNAHGLFIDNHYTSAYDMYLIAKACYDTPGFMDIVTTQTYQLPDNPRYPSGWFIQSTNKMQSRSSPYYRSYVNGMKTGSLDEVGHNFVTMCEQDGERYICVVIGAQKSSPEDMAAFDSTALIMDYLYENYSLRSANSLEFPVTDVPLRYSSDTDTLLLYAENEVMAVLPDSADESSFQQVYNLPEFVSAPVKKGDEIGTVDYYLAGNLVGTSKLVSRADADRSIILFVFGKIGEMFSSLYFKVLVVVIIVFLGVYALSLYMKRRKQDRMQKVRRRRK